MKHSFFQAAVVTILLYGCTTWTLTKRLKKKLDGNYTRMLGAILNKSWRQNPTRYQLYGHLPPITKTIQVRRTRQTGHWWKSKDELISDVLLWTPHMAKQKQDDLLEHTYSSYVRIRDVALKTCLRRWTIGRSGERGSGISVLAARHDDDDDDLMERFCFDLHSAKYRTKYRTSISKVEYSYLKHVQDWNNQFLGIKNQVEEILSNDKKILQLRKEIFLLM